MIGTLEYMAPEILLGAAEGPSADRYALGMVAYEMLTGRSPFAGLNCLALLNAQVYTPPPSPRRFRADLGARRRAGAAAATGEGPEPSVPVGARLRGRAAGRTGAHPTAPRAYGPEQVTVSPARHGGRGGDPGACRRRWGRTTPNRDRSAPARRRLDTGPGGECPRWGAARAVRGRPALWGLVLGLVARWLALSALYPLVALFDRLFGVTTKYGHFDLLAAWAVIYLGLTVVVAGGLLAVWLWKRRLGPVVRSHVAGRVAAGTARNAVSHARLSL